MKKLYTLNNEFIKEVVEDDISENFTGIIEFSSRTRVWRVNGKRHREDGPAAEWSNGTKSWWFNGERHRIDGPAIEWSGGATSWYLYNIECTPESFNLLKDVMKLKGLTTLPQL